MRSAHTALHSECKDRREDARQGAARTTEGCRSHNARMATLKNKVQEEIKNVTFTFAQRMSEFMNDAQH